MADFIIECPSCGSYASARKGIFGTQLFGTHTIDCACGYKINVSADKVTSRTCPHCGNEVIFDQSKGDKALCPVCHEKINTSALVGNMAQIRCPSCSCGISVDKNASEYTCPLCDTVIDVQHQIAAQNEKNKGLASVIKYEGDNSTFVWKHPIEDFNLGSQLIVHESQEAIFFRDGQALDLFGPGRYTLSTQNIPLLEELYKIPFNADTPFHSEVYFINKTVQMSIKWGTPDKVRFIDPLTGTPLELGASGEMNVQVSDSRRLLIKLIGTMKGVSWDNEDGGFSKSLKNSFRPLITSAVKTNLPAVIKNEAIDLLEIDTHLDTISANLREKILPGFEEYGLTIPQFYVTAVSLPEDDPNFKRIKELHTITLQTRIIQAEATVKTAQAQGETQYRTVQEQSKAAIEAARRDAELQRQLTQTEIAKREAERRVIEAQAEAQAQRMAGLTEAEIMKAKGYSQKDVINAEVQKAYAEGIGNMGPAISAGGGGSIVGDMMGLGLGMAAASAVAPQIGNMIGNFMPQNTDNAAVQAVSPDTWDCECGVKGISSKFCPDCGKPKPAPKPAENGWTCTACGKTGITSKFCPDCGAKKPEPPAAWDCPSCGKTGITSGFCPDCGTKKPEAPATWTCPDCGHTDITSNFCPDCGRKRD